MERLEKTTTTSKTVMASPSESGARDEVPSPSASLTDYLGYLQSQIQPLTRTAAQLPGPSDLSFHRSLDRALLRDLDATKDEILGTLNSLLGSITRDVGSGKGRAVEQAGWQLKAEDLVDGGGFTRKLGDVVDTLLERADTRLDEHLGKAKPSTGSARNRESLRAGDKMGAVPAVGPLPTHLLNANIQPLPQKKFSKKPDNSRTQLWKHSLEQKPHAKVPLSWTAPAPGPDEPAAVVGVRQGMYCAEGDPRENPYYYEIKNFVPPQHASHVAQQVEELLQPPPLQKDEPTAGPIPFLWVDDERTFQTLFDHLSEERVREIAIDVEHHNYRSFQGLVCLVQISTRWQDFIIDALSPAVRNVSARLNQVFADDNKVKILHGAEHDILWLQRDLQVYIVGLFDTYHATNVLNFPQHSLAYLLARYIKFEADKRYQLADWRIRPLNKEMMFYARSDTHSLIYIYDCLRFEIAKKEGLAGIGEVFELSKRTACKVYAKEEWDPKGDGRDGWRSQWKRVGGIEAAGVDERWEKEGVDGLGRTERIFRALHDWRDQVARQEDESVRYILPSSNLLNLSSRAPSTPEATLSCVGQAFKKRVAEVGRIVSRESAHFETAQKKRSEREKEKLKSKQEVLEDEEMGEPVGRNSLASPALSLWPADEATTSAKGPSPIASLLFADGLSGQAGAPGAAHDKEVKGSLFAPRPKAANAQKIMTGIKSELTAALMTILGRSRETAGDQYEEQRPPSGAALSEQEKIPSVAGQDRQLPDISDVTADVPEASPSSSPSPLAEDRVLKVKKSKKRAPNDELASSPKDKKARWSKEEKERRRREKDGKESESNGAVNQTIQPFDYSTAKSVLDSNPTVMGGKEDKRKKKDKKSKDKEDKDGGAKRSKGKTADAAESGKDGKADRYASISVRRDRREQQGGKSMSFAR